MVYSAFSFDDGLGIGVDDETNVSLDYKEGDNAFTGKISKVTISVQAPAVNSPKIQQEF